jgi:hypothetical protein
MVTAGLMGGLGNKMFQIAAAFSLSKQNNDELIFNINDCNSAHQPPTIRYTDNILRKINFVNHQLPIKYVHHEQGFHFQEINYKKDLKLHGYFQSEKYFSKDKKKIKTLFNIDKKTKELIKEKYGDILNLKTCSIHIRRTDYTWLSNFHTVLDMEYFNKSMSYFDKDTTFLIFSDDINWCKNNFLGDNFIFIEGNLDYVDLWLMSLCKNNIIANSSFAWWGAYLNNNKNKKVICPKNWFGESNSHLITDDLFCKNWIVI